MDTDHLIVQFNSMLLEKISFNAVEGGTDFEPVELGVYNKRKINNRK